MSLYDAIRSAGGGEIVGALAQQAGVSRDQAERALRVLLPDLGRAIRRTAESRTGAPAVHAAMRDERYARYLEEPEALREPGAVADGERVLLEMLDDSSARSSSGTRRPRSTPTRSERAGSCRWSRPWPWRRSGASCASRRRRSRGSAPARATISMSRSWMR